MKLKLIYSLLLIVSLNCFADSFSWKDVTSKFNHLLKNLKDKFHKNVYDDDDTHHYDHTDQEQNVNNEKKAIKQQLDSESFPDFGLANKSFENYKNVMADIDYLDVHHRGKRAAPVIISGYITNKDSNNLGHIFMNKDSMTTVSCGQLCSKFKSCMGFIWIESKNACSLLDEIAHKVQQTGSHFYMKEGVLSPEEVEGYTFKEDTNVPGGRILYSRYHSSTRQCASLCDANHYCHSFILDSSKETATCHMMDSVATNTKQEYEVGYFIKKNIHPIDPPKPAGPQEGFSFDQDTDNSGFNIYRVTPSNQDMCANLCVFDNECIGFVIDMRSRETICYLKRSFAITKASSGFHLYKKITENISKEIKGYNYETDVSNSGYDLFSKDVISLESCAEFCDKMTICVGFVADVRGFYFVCTFKKSLNANENKNGFLLYTKKGVEGTKVRPEPTTTTVSTTQATTTTEATTTEATTTTVTTTTAAVPNFKAVGASEINDYQWIKNINNNGEDLMVQRYTTPQDCANLCTSKQDCVAFVMDLSVPESICFIKGTFGGIENKNGFHYYVRRNRQHTTTTTSPLVAVDVPGYTHYENSINTGPDLAAKTISTVKQCKQICDASFQCKAFVIDLNQATDQCHALSALGWSRSKTNVHSYLKKSVWGRRRKRSTGIDKRQNDNNGYQYYDYYSHPASSVPNKGKTAVKNSPNEPAHVDFTMFDSKTDNQLTQRELTQKQRDENRYLKQQQKAVRKELKKEQKMQRKELKAQQKLEKKQLKEQLNG